ncbi:hypothetical protein Plhal304r1_c058g0145351 [Plasmopara halstedii]
MSDVSNLWCKFYSNIVDTVLLSSIAVRTGLGCVQSHAISEIDLAANFAIYAALDVPKSSSYITTTKLGGLNINAPIEQNLDLKHRPSCFKIHALLFLQIKLAEPIPCLTQITIFSPWQKFVLS